MSTNRSERSQPAATVRQEPIAALPVSAHPRTAPNSPDDDLLNSGLVEEAQARIEAGNPHRFDALLLSIAVKKLRLELAAAQDHNRQLVDRARWIMQAERRRRP